jgi:hypothetical protein
VLLEVQFPTWLLFQLVNAQGTTLGKGSPQTWAATKVLLITLIAANAVVLGVSPVQSIPTETLTFFAAGLIIISASLAVRRFRERAAARKCDKPNT